MGDQSRHRMPTAQVGFEGYAQAQIKPKGEANSVQNCSLTHIALNAISTEHLACLWIDQMNSLTGKTGAQAARAVQPDPTR
jgi:hypothetical protein